MVGILAAIFIGNPRDYADTDVRRRYGMICGILGVVLNVMLCTAKFVLGSSVGSVAMTADAFNNLSDAAGSVIQTVGFKMASKKPDREHPFGHGRMEYLAGLVIAFLILYMGVELVRRSFAALSSVRNLANFPSMIFFASSNFLCLISKRVFRISAKRFVYLSPNRFSATILDGCILAISSNATLW